MSDGDRDFIPLGTHIMLRKEDLHNTSAGGIALPEVTSHIAAGIVLEIGTNAFRKDKDGGRAVSRGSRVLYHAGHTIRTTATENVFITESGLVAVMTGGDA